MIRRFAATVFVAVAVPYLLVSCAPERGEPELDVVLGSEVRLGEGTVTSYSTLHPDGSPAAIGVTFAAGTLDGLPTARSDGHRCFDLDGDGQIEADTECLPTHERVLPLPTEVSRRDDIPFKWVLLNWNPMGHAPEHIYGPAHFDIHYYIDPIENTFALMPGPCGPEYIRCDQFERAVRPVPENYVHPDFVSVDAAAPAMGNHLIDLSSAEFHGTPFERTWIYGAYDGRITFWEEMVTRDYLAGRPKTCFPIKVPADVQISGYYPTRSCFDFDPASGAQTASVEGFVHREAAPPATTVAAIPSR